MILGRCPRSRTRQNLTRSKHPQRDFDRMPGVISTTVGYSGSKRGKPNPTYRNVMDYAESIRVVFDPSVLSYEDLLKSFFEMHTPEDPRYAGTQYRSAIFVHTREQRESAEAAVGSRGRLGGFVPVEDAGDFYRGEEYHQKYLEKMTARY